jgi:predicted methyltransferase
VDVKAGQGLLDLKNQLRAYGVFEPVCAALSTQAKYYPTLYTMAEQVAIGKIGELAESFSKSSFDYIIAGEPLNRYADWGSAYAALCDMLKPGGELLYKMSSPTNEITLYKTKRGET